MCQLESVGIRKSLVSCHQIRSRKHYQIQFLRDIKVKSRSNNDRYNNSNWSVFQDGRQLIGAPQLIAPPPMALMRWCRVQNNLWGVLYTSTKGPQILAQGGLLVSLSVSPPPLPSPKNDCELMGLWVLPAYSSTFYGCSEMIQGWE